MLKISDDDILTQAKMYFDEYNKGTGTITEEDFVRKSFPKLAEAAEAEHWNMLKKDLKFQIGVNEKRIKRIKMSLAAGEKIFTDKDLEVTENRLERVQRDWEQAQKSLYPYNVYIPKSIFEMQQGDFEPARVITVDKPIMGEWGPMWFGCTKDGVNLRYGYKNGDSRFISDYALNDTTIHGLMAGTTGSGKSVALNTVIYGACYEYAPWELNFTLSDAKIVEFKSLAKNNPMPQITTVAATTDADYLASVVQFKYSEMQNLNVAFTKAGEVFGSDVKNIMDFRKTTGLCQPRNILIFDEFQAMFAGAGKNLKVLVETIDKLARLGRNTGYHLYLTSQELGSDVPQGTLNQISLRCALGCTPQVSEQIIGNDAAKVNNGKKGKLIINTDSVNCNKKDNVLITIPWCKPENASVMAGEAIQRGKEFGVTPVMRFYDQEDILYEEKYQKFINNFKRDKNRIVLGEPSFMMDSDEQCVDIKFQGESNENIFVISATIDHLIRHFKELRMNQDYPDITNCVLCAETAFVKKADAESLCKKNKQYFFDDGSYDSEFFKIARSLIYRRKLCIEADKRVFEEPMSTEQSDKTFLQLFKDVPDIDTPTNRSRFYHMYGLLNQSPVFRQGFGLSGASGDGEIIVNTIKVCMKMFGVYGATSRKITFADLPHFNMWVLGLNKVLGLGRDSKSKNVDAFKQIMQESSQMNIHFYIFTTNVEDTANLRAGAKWFIFDKPNSADISRTKFNDNFPETVNDVLAVLMDSDDKEHPQKFKKLFFDGEIPSA